MAGESRAKTTLAAGARQRSLFRLLAMLAAVSPITHAGVSSDARATDCPKVRLLLAVVACGAVFFGAIWAGSRVFAGDGDPAAAGVPPSETTTSHESDSGQGAGKKSAGPSGKESARSDPLDPRERLRAGDMTLARKAVLRPSDMNARWKRARLSADEGPGCPENDADLSRFTVTGKARSAFKAGDSFIESRVRLFGNAGQAALYFEATSNETILRCIRNGIKRNLSEIGWRPRVLYARLETEPPLGARTAIYLVNYVITLSDGRKMEYPVELLTFQVGRAVAGVSFALVPSDDGLRPCSCELEEARLVASRLYRT